MDPNMEAAASDVPKPDSDVPKPLCLICKEHLQQAKIMPCGHIFCKQCIYATVFGHDGNRCSFCLSQLTVVVHHMKCPHPECGEHITFDGLHCIALLPDDGDEDRDVDTDDDVQEAESSPEDDVVQEARSSSEDDDADVRAAFREVCSSEYDDSLYSPRASLGYGDDGNDPPSSSGWEEMNISVDELQVDEELSLGGSDVQFDAEMSDEELPLLECAEHTDEGVCDCIVNTLNVLRCDYKASTLQLLQDITFVAGHLEESSREYIDFYVYAIKLVYLMNDLNAEENDVATTKCMVATLNGLGTMRNILREYWLV